MKTSAASLSLRDRRRLLDPTETADREELYRNQRHPYTVSLFSAAPNPVPNRPHKRIVLPGEVPSPVDPPTGCAFHPRCPLTRTCASDTTVPGERVEVTVLGESVKVMKRCVDEEPLLENVEGNPSHTTACWYEREIARMRPEQAMPTA